MRLGLRRRLRGGSAMADLALAAVLTASILAITSRLEPEAGERVVDGAGYGAVAVAGAVLVLRRRAPLAVTAVVTGALLFYVVRDYTGGPVFVTAFVALYTVASTRPRRQAFAVAAAAAAVLVGVGLVAHEGEGLVHLVFVGWTAAAVFLGDAVRSRRERLEALEERARRLEETREEEARRRVAEERLRIAHDLHDSVAHSMATINVQSGVAAHVIGRSPGQAREALEAIRRASGEVLEELSALLGLLRGEEGSEAPLAPTPRLDQVGDLLESVRQAGVDVSLQVEGSPGPVPQPVGVAAYRIVQESLTNVIRHAGDARAVVTLEYGGEGDLAVEVTDDGRGSNGPGGGSGVGIAGMRERVQATGGHLEAGPLPGGGFRVRARWPRRR
ncbi:MAG TPA: histidine kinase [Acidimicrobiales bacterium]|nr:histidine kinase [Acidimicrobiales bacterium]